MVVCYEFHEGTFTDTNESALALLHELIHVHKHLSTKHMFIADNLEDKTRSGKEEDEADVSWPITLRSSDFARQEGKVKQRIAIAQAPKVPSSWKSLVGKLWRLQRLRVFDHYYQAATDMLRNPRVTAAFDLDREPPRLRDAIRPGVT